MMLKPNRLVAAALSLLLATSGSPLYAVAEQLQEQQPQETVQEAVPDLAYRVHAVQDPAWETEDGWRIYDVQNDRELDAEPVAAPEAEGEAAPEAESEAALEGEGESLVESPDAARTAEEAPAEADGEEAAETETSDAATEDAGEVSAAQTPNPVAETPAPVAPALLDSIELRAQDSAVTLRYRVRSLEQTWPEEWAVAGEAATAETGIYGLQIRVDDETNLHVAYRARTDVGDWGDWVRDGEELVLEGDQPFCAIQAYLFAEEAPADDSTSEAEEPGIETDGEQTEQERAPAPVDNVATDDEEPAALAPQAPAATSAKQPTATTTTTTKPQTTKTETQKATPEKTKQTKTETQTPHIRYRVHIKNTGWLDWAADGALGGLSASGLVDGLRVRVTGMSGSITGRAHVQGAGWMKSVTGNNKLLGASGLSRRIEAVKLKLNGDVAKDYDLWYHVRVKSKGWLNWVKNGSLAGTTGESLRIEAIEMLLVKKGDTAPQNLRTSYADTPAKTKPSVSYCTHVQTIGWQQYVANGTTAGTTGMSKRLEALRIKVAGVGSGGVEYRTHVQKEGWMGWVRNGKLSGTTGRSLRMEAICIRLTGKAAENYDIYYRTHVQHLGWTAWAKNGEKCGSQGMSYRMEGLQIVLRKKGAKAPSASGSNSTLAFLNARLHGVDISGWDAGINIHALDADFVIIKATEGTTGTLAQPAYYNKDYKTWANQALADGKLIGFYHYANGGDPIEEADWFYYAIKDYKGRCIVALDWEGTGNPLHGTGKDVKWCKKFLDRISKKMGCTPFMYKSKSWTNYYNWSLVAQKYPLWGAEYPDMKPMYGYQDDPWQDSYLWGAWGKNPTIFQYTSTGVLENNGGIEMFDLDLFYGNKTDWMRYAQTTNAYKAK